MKYKIQLTMYGTVAERADVVIEASTPEEAKEIALKQSEEGEIKFSNKGESPDGWEYQVEDCETQ